MEVISPTSGPSALRVDVLICRCPAGAPLSGKSPHGPPLAASFSMRSLRGEELARFRAPVTLQQILNQTNKVEGNGRKLHSFTLFVPITELLRPQHPTCVEHLRSAAVRFATSASKPHTPIPPSHSRATHLCSFSHSPPTVGTRRLSQRTSLRSRRGCGLTSADCCGLEGR